MSAHLVTSIEASSEESTWIEIIGAQHVSLRGAAHAAEKALRSIADGTDETEPAAALAQLAGFHRELLEHLGCEEREGRLALALSGAPHWQRKADLLQGDHARFRASFAALLGDVERAREALAWGTIHQRFAAFRRAFAAHEEIEDEILHRASLEDLGGGDEEARLPAAACGMARGT